MVARCIVVLAVVVASCAPTVPAPPPDAGPPPADAGSPLAREDAGPSELDATAARAIAYLATTELELGLDVVASLQIYGELRGDARALEVAAARRAGLRAEDLASYGALLTMAKPAFPPAALAPGVDGAPPNPADDLGDDRSSRCMEAFLRCAPSAACLEFVELDGRGGYVLTHQAVALLFARWTGCALPLDVEARRHALAQRLRAEAEADPAPGDLAYERLAMLGHLGFAAAIDPVWWERLAGAQADDGCFPLAPGAPCHPHPTGVALWALAHAP